MIKKKTILEISIFILPTELCDLIKDQYENFLYSGTSFKLPSELNEKPLSENFTMTSIEQYFRDQKKSTRSNCLAKTLDEFIKEYGLEFEVWIISYLEEHDITLDDVDEIYISVE